MPLHETYGDPVDARNLASGIAGAGLRRDVAAMTERDRRPTATCRCGGRPCRGPLVAAARPACGDGEADVAIVGAGYTGLWTAYYLAKADPTLRIVVLERGGRRLRRLRAQRRLVLGAVPRLVGQDRARRPGRDAAVAMQRAMFATVDEVGTVVAEPRASTCTGPRAARHAGPYARAARAGAGGDRGRPARGASARTTTAGCRPAEAETSVGRRRTCSARTFTPHTAAIHPARLVRGLAQVVERLGVTIHEGTAVTAIEPGVVRARHGSVRAPILHPRHRGLHGAAAGHKREVAPVYSLMLATEPLPDVVLGRGRAARRGRRSPTSGTSSSTGSGPPTAGSPSAGAERRTTSARTIQPEFDREPAVFDELHRVLVDLFPASATPPSPTGGAVRSASPATGTPPCGLDPATGLGWAGGYVGDGVGTTNLAGRTLADLVLRRDTDLVRLPWVNHRSRRWEPEPLRFLGVNAGLRVMSSADRVETRTGRPPRRAHLMNRVLGH